MSGSGATSRKATVKVTDKLRFPHGRSEMFPGPMDAPDGLGYRLMGGWQAIRRLRLSLFALAVAVGAPTESLVLTGRVSATLTVAGGAAGLALLARRRHPALGPVTAVVVISVVAAWGDHAFWRSTVLVLAIVVAAWRLGRDNPLRVAAPAGLAVAPLQVAHILLAPPSAGLNPIAAVAVPVSCWSAGAVIRRRSEDAADLAGRAAAAAGCRAEVAQRAVAEGRANIARELHDVVAHTLTVMTLQAGGARMQLDSDPDRAMTAVYAVERAGREALKELRRMVELFDGGDRLRFEPQPGMAGIDHLVEQMGAAGLQLAVTVAGKRPPIGSGLDLACYRVV